MNRLNFASAYEPIPQALEYRVKHTLERLDDAPRAARRLSARTAVLVLALTLAACGVAYAVYESVTANLFGWFYGGNQKEELLNGDIAPMGQSLQLGELVYTLEEMVYKSEGEFQGLYGVVRIAPAEGANVVLLPEDLSVDDPAGYLLHYGDTGRALEDDAPSYAELAERLDAKLLVATVGINSLTVDGADYSDCYGSAWLPQEDGTLLGTLELTDGVPRAERYELELWLSNWEATRDGFWLRDGEDDTQLQTNWAITIAPDKKED